MERSPLFFHSSEWKEYYNRTQALPEPEHIKPFLDCVPPGGRILDFGCGTGRHSFAFLRDRGDIIVDMLDAQLADISIAKSAGIGEMLHMRFEEWQSPAQAYDAIWSHNALFFMQEAHRSRVFGQLAHALKPGGILDFTFVEEGNAAQTMPTYGITKNALEALLAESKLGILQWQRREDMAYGKSRTYIPTFVVRARKE